jgi:hypothetical protein
VDGLFARLGSGIGLAPSSGTERLRRGLAGLVAVYALVLCGQGVIHGDFVSPAALIMLALALAVYANRGGRAVRDWGLVFLALIAYVLAGSAVPDLGLEVHYTPQIEVERLLAFGELPTLWLQEHLYGGAVGALEIFALVMYLSHFVAPVLLASLIWLYWPGRGFGDLFFGILAVSLLGEITFLVAPTAPPWLAGDQGVIPHVHHVIRETLYGLGLDGIAARKDAAGSYNIVAAVPSLHAAWPVIGLLVIRKHGLPRWLFSVQAVLVVGVAFAIVYTGDHYVVDVLAGIVYALAAWWLVERALRIGRDPEPAVEPAAAGAALRPLPAPQMLVSRIEDPARSESPTMLP